MKLVKQLFKKMVMITKYIIFYLFISFLSILVFAMIYHFKEIPNPIHYSIKVFWGISAEIIDKISMVYILEIVVRDLFNVVIASSVLLKFLKPVNPIIIADRVIYNNKSEKYKFCYWIMLSEGKFLFDIKIRIFLSTSEAHQEGVNSLKTVWQSKDEEVINLQQARGIRYAQINKEESEELYKLIKNHNTDISDKEYELNFVLNGSDANGNLYYGWKRYSLEEICYGYQFVPLQEHEYTNPKYFTGNEEDINYKINKSDKELFRYQHFGKLFYLEGSENYTGKEKNIILTKKQIIEGQYRGLGQKLLDFCSWVIMLFLDRSHWKSWCKKVLEDIMKPLIQKIRKLLRK